MLHKITAELFSTIHPSSFIFSLLEASHYRVAQLQEKTVNPYGEPFVIWHGPSPITSGAGSQYSFTFKEDNGYFMCFESGKRGDLFTLADSLHMTDYIFHHIGKPEYIDELIRTDDFLPTILYYMEKQGLREEEDLIEHEINRNICGTEISGNDDCGYTKDAVEQARGKFTPQTIILGKYDL